MSSKEVSYIKENMIIEFDKRLDEYVVNYRKTSKRDLKKKIKELDEYVIQSDERLGMFQLALAAMIYKERYRKEIPLKGVTIDASGNVVRNVNNNIHLNVQGRRRK